MLKVAKFAARGESASILGNRTGFSCNAPGKKLQHTNACSARVEQLLISWRAAPLAKTFGVSMRRRQFLFQLMDLLTERSCDTCSRSAAWEKLPSSATATEYRS